MFDGEHLACSAEAVDYLVGYEEDAVAVADVAEHGPIFVAGDGSAHGGGDGFGDDGGYGLGAFVEDELFDGVGAEDGALGGGLSAEFASVGDGLGGVEHSGVCRLEVVALGVGVSAEPDDAGGGSVV